MWLRAPGTVNRAQAHPAATVGVATTGHATIIVHTLELPSWSPRGSGATQTIVCVDLYQCVLYTH